MTTTVTQQCAHEPVAVYRRPLRRCLRKTFVAIACLACGQVLCDFAAR